MLFPAPPMPAFPADQQTVTREALRYEDLAQDGRIMPIALPPLLNGLWRGALADHPGAKSSLAKGILPILTRLTIVSHEQPIRVDRDVEARSGFQLAHGKEHPEGNGSPGGSLAQGEINRIFMLLWCDVHGAAGRIGGISGRQPGPLTLAGSLFAEHTFTRPFAPPDQRRVTRLGGGYPDLPEREYAQPTPASASELPEGGRWLDELAPDPIETVFSLDHTDSNQHVNSLVYVRLFQDAVWRRLAARQVDRPSQRFAFAARPGEAGCTKARTREVDVAYRKPCFAGDRLTAQVRLFEHVDGSLGAAGFLASTDGKPRCFVRIVVGP